MTNNAEPYCKKWHLSNPALLAETSTSTVYRVTFNHQYAVLKRLKPAGEIDEINAGRALRCFNGIGSVKLMQQDAKALLLEYVEGENLTALVANGEDESAMIIVADMISRLHNAYSGSLPEDLTPLRDRFASLFFKAEQDINDSRSIFSRAASVAKTLLNQEKDIGVLHGDIHHGNIKHSESRGWLALDPKGLIGERTYDACNALLNPWHRRKIVENESRLLAFVDILSDKLQLKPSRLLAFAFAHAALCACWAMEDGDDPQHPLTMAQMIEKHLV